MIPLRHSLPTIHTLLRGVSRRLLVPVPIDILFVKAPLPYILFWDRDGGRPHRLLTPCTRYRSLLRVLRTGRRYYCREETRSIQRPAEWRPNLTVVDTIDMLSFILPSRERERERIQSTILPASKICCARETHIVTYNFYFLRILICDEI